MYASSLDKSNPKRETNKLVPFFKGRIYDKLLPFVLDTFQSKKLEEGFSR